LTQFVQFVHFVHVAQDVENDENDVFSTSESFVFDALSRKVILKVLKSVRKSVSSKKKISSLSSFFKIVVYLLNVKMMYEKDVIFQIFISRHVNAKLIAYDERIFHFTSYKIHMQQKAQRYANAKIFACHLINVKTTIM
jgi:hypothetical protein